MFQVNDTVLYGTEGVCVVEEIAERTFDRKTQEYYVLRPVDGVRRSTIFVPTQNEKLCARMHRLLSADEIREMIRQLPGAEPIWIDDDNLRRQRYAEILREGDRLTVLRLLKALYRHREALKTTGRKFHASDERFLKEGEKLIYSEFAHVLQMEVSQVLPYIEAQLQAPGA